MRVKWYYDHNQFKKSFTCEICDKKFLDHGWSSDELSTFARDNHCCLECANWLKIHKTNQGVEIIDGIAYRFNPLVKITKYTLCGGNGEVKCILHSDGTVKLSNDIWILGEVPERFRHVLKDTGWFISPKYYKRLNRGVMHCESKMCMDRYHCYRYDYHQEFESGPVNIPPPTWIAGTEKCPEYIPISAIANYSYFNINDLCRES